MIPQDRVVDESETAALTSYGEARTDLRDEGLLSQRGDPLLDAHSDHPRGRTGATLAAHVVNDGSP